MSNTPPAQPKKETVWMKCRANEKCEGNEAYVVFKKQQPLIQGGGTSYRYRCTKCKGVWHLTR